MVPIEIKTPNNTNCRIHSTRESKFKFFRLEQVDLIDFPLQKCNILNFDLTLMGMSPIDYDVTFLFYFDILDLGPHCI